MTTMSVVRPNLSSTIESHGSFLRVVNLPCTGQGFDSAGSRGIDDYRMPTLPIRSDMQECPTDSRAGEDQCQGFRVPSFRGTNYSNLQ